MRALASTEQRMWHTIRVMRTNVDATLLALASGASTTRAAAYLRRLAKQGLLVCIAAEEKTVGIPARYRLVSDPGPHAPGSEAATAFAAARSRSARAPRTPIRKVTRTRAMGPRAIRAMLAGGGLFGSHVLECAS